MMHSASAQSSPEVCCCPMRLQTTAPRTVDGVNVKRATASMGAQPDTVFSFAHAHVEVSQSQSHELPSIVYSMVTCPDSGAVTRRGGGGGGHVPHVIGHIVHSPWRSDG